MKAEFKKDLIVALKDFDLLSLAQLIKTAELTENEVEAILQECIDHGYYLGSRDAWTGHKDCSRRGPAPTQNSQIYRSDSR